MIDLEKAAVALVEAETKTPWESPESEAAVAEAEERLIGAARAYVKTLDQFVPGEDPTPVKLAEQVLAGEHGTREAKLAEAILEQDARIKELEAGR